MIEGLYGKDVLSVWLTLNSFYIFLTLADLGLSNSLINYISSSENEEKSRKAIFTVFIF